MREFIVKAEVQMRVMAEGPLSAQNRFEETMDKTYLSKCVVKSVIPAQFNTPTVNEDLQRINAQHDDIAKANAIDIYAPREDD